MRNFIDMGQFPNRYAAHCHLQAWHNHVSPKKRINVNFKLIHVFHVLVRTHDNAHYVVKRSGATKFSPL